MDWRQSKSSKNRHNRSMYNDYDTTQFRYQSNPSSANDPFLRYEASYSNDRYGLDCRSCYGPFGDGEMQLCVRVQSRSDDRKNAVPYHLKCFFEKQRVSSEAEISGFESLRIADQNRIQKQIARTNVKVVLANKDAKIAGNKRKGGNADIKIKMSAKAVRDYGVEYSKSSRAMCCGCRQKILKDLVRCKKMIYNTEVGMNFGGQPLWHHLDCFAKLQSELGWYGDGNQLPGFKELAAKDQEVVRQAICPIALENIPEIKKLKKTTAVENEQAKSIDKILTEQNIAFFANRDLLDKHLKQQKIIEFLQHNQQEVPNNEQEILNAAADLLTFGALSKCPSCNTGQLILLKRGFGCSGHISEWAKCDYFVPYPVRTACKFPARTPKAIGKIKLQVQDRVFREIETADALQTIRKPVDFMQPKVDRVRPPLYLMEIVIIGRLSKTRPELKKIVEKMGGKITTKLQANTAVVVSTQKEFDAMGEKILEAQNLGIQVVLEEFFDSIVQGAVAVDYIAKNCISSWGSDPTTRINQHEIDVVKSSGIYTRAIPKTVKLKVINGTAVDPESGLVDTCHVFIDKQVRYFATLNNVDIQAGRNSYYKLQVLEDDRMIRYFLFTSRGRIGTIIGTKGNEFCHSSAQAVEKFRQLYLSLTGNQFGVKTFQKKSGLYYPIDVQFDDETESSSSGQIVEEPSKLTPPVQDIMRLIFDVNQMKRTMREFDLDTDKMPLGKISSAQVMQAMAVLNHLSTLIKKNGKRAEFIGASNHFYSLIPHDFGTHMPPVINTLETIKQKNEMLQSLLEMEIAYSLMNQTQSKSAGANRLDMQYEMLNTNLERVEPGSLEHDRLVKYLKNTHADTHKMYTLEIQDVFRVCRSGEQKRFEPFEDLPNRKLLWHGSRITNYAGILSHGLRIAPPEATPTGYMFGKGIYFADMVSKSANYCGTTPQTNTGLVMLCDVALGNSMECTAAEYIVDLPRGVHSVKGVGKTYPDPRESVLNEEGVEIPLGGACVDLSVDSSLLYNEFIVYDVAQVQIKYLFNLKFNYLSLHV